MTHRAETHPAISIHALREKGDGGGGQRQEAGRLFLSTPSARRTTKRLEGLTPIQKFLSTPSARRATVILKLKHDDDKFLSTPSARRATSSASSSSTSVPIFLSTPSARRATCPAQLRQVSPGISIHALREEGDRFWFCCEWRRRHFYPHPPRGERQGQCAGWFSSHRFLSTPSVRRATMLAMTAFAKDAISIHALREEGDWGC